jgi:hypothetical protein
LLAAALGFAAVVPLSFWLAPDLASVSLFGWAAVVCVLGVSLYLAARSLHLKPRTVLWEFRLQAASVAAAVLATLPFHLRSIGAW